MVKYLIISMEGTVLENEQADVLMSTHSQLPKCFVLVKDEKDLILGTGSTEEINDMKKPKKRVISNTEGGIESSQYSKKARWLAAGGFNFLNIDFVAEVDEKKCWLTRSHTLFSPDPNLLKLVSTTKDLCCWTNVVEKHWVKVYRRLSLSKDTVMAILNNFRFDLLFSSTSNVTRTWKYSINS